MPTINQLVRKPRKTAKKKSKSPALGTIHNSLKTRYYKRSSSIAYLFLCQPEFDRHRKMGRMVYESAGLSSLCRYKKN